MGYGDEIMAAGEARRAQARDPRPVAVLGRDGRPRWHPLWAGNPRIARPAEVAAGRDVQAIVSGPGARPYIDYPRMAREFRRVFPGGAFTTRLADPRLPWRYTGWRCAPGELPAVPRRAPGGYVVVEPHLKPGASPNKQWGRTRWQALVDLVPGLGWVQPGPPGTPALAGVARVETATFLDACAVLAGAAAAVLPEGGLHHAAAALGVPAVVIFGGMTSPANTGYDGHVNLFDGAGGPGPCGMRTPCTHCARAMAAIRPEVVAYHLEHILDGQRAGAA